MEYPKAKKVDIIDDYHGTKVADPYRWLEDVDSPDTKAWIKAQKELTEKHLSQIPYRKDIRKRLKEIHEIPQYVDGLGWDIVQFGDLYFFKKVGNNNDSTKIFVQQGEDSQEELLVDTKDLVSNKSDFVFVRDVSRDQKYILFGVCRFGSDKTVFRVMDFETKEILANMIDNTSTPVSCLWNEGVFYSKLNKTCSNEVG